MGYSEVKTPEEMPHVVFRFNWYVFADCFLEFCAGIFGVIGSFKYDLISSKLVSVFW